MPGPRRPGLVAKKIMIQGRGVKRHLHTYWIRPQDAQRARLRAARGEQDEQMARLRAARAGGEQSVVARPVAPPEHPHKALAKYFKDRGVEVNKDTLDSLIKYFKKPDGSVLTPEDLGKMFKDPGKWSLPVQEDTGIMEPWDQPRMRDVLNPDGSVKMQHFDIKMKFDSVSSHGGTSAGFGLRVMGTPITGDVYPTGHEKAGELVGTPTGGRAVQMNEALSRRFDHEGGSQHVHHSIFKMAPEFRGGGLGMEIIKNQFRGYPQVGMGRVTVSSAWMGNYVWGRAGFRVTNAGSLMDGFESAMTRVQSGPNKVFKSAGVPYTVAELKEMHDIPAHGSQAVYKQAVPTFNPATGRMESLDHETGLMVEGKPRQLWKEYVLGIKPVGSGSGANMGGEVLLRPGNFDYENVRDYLKIGNPDRATRVQADAELAAKQLRERPLRVAEAEAAFGEERRAEREAARAAEEAQATRRAAEAEQERVQAARLAVADVYLNPVGQPSVTALVARANHQVGDEWGLVGNVAFAERATWAGTNLARQRAVQAMSGEYNQERANAALEVVRRYEAAGVGTHATATSARDRAARLEREANERSQADVGRGNAHAVTAVQALREQGRQERATAAARPVTLPTPPAPVVAAPPVPVAPRGAAAAEHARLVQDVQSRTQAVARTQAALANAGSRREEGAASDAHGRASVYLQEAQAALSAYERARTPVAQQAIDAANTAMDRARDAGQSQVQQANAAAAAHDAVIATHQTTATALGGGGAPQPAAGATGYQATARVTQDLHAAAGDATPADRYARAAEANAVSANARAGGSRGQGMTAGSTAYRASMNRSTEALRANPTPAGIPHNEQQAHQAQVIATAHARAEGMSTSEANGIGYVAHQTTLARMAGRPLAAITPPPATASTATTPTGAAAAVTAANRESVVRAALGAPPPARPRLVGRAQELLTEAQRQTPAERTAWVDASPSPAERARRLQTVEEMTGAAQTRRSEYATREADHLRSAGDLDGARLARARAGTERRAASAAAIAHATNEATVIAQAAVRNVDRARAEALLPKAEAELRRMRAQGATARVALQAYDEQGGGEDRTRLLLARGQASSDQLAAEVARDQILHVARDHQMSAADRQRYVATMASKEGRIAEASVVRAQEEAARQQAHAQDRVRAAALLPKQDAEIDRLTTAAENTHAAVTAFPPRSSQHGAAMQVHMAARAALTEAQQRRNHLRRLAAGETRVGGSDEMLPLSQEVRVAAREVATAKEGRIEERRVAAAAATEAKRQAQVAADRTRVVALLPKQEAEIARLEEAHAATITRSNRAEDARTFSVVTPSAEVRAEARAANLAEAEARSALTTAQERGSQLRSLSRGTHVSVWGNEGPLTGAARESALEVAAAKEGRIETRRVAADRAFKAEVGTDRARAQAALPKAHAAWEAAGAKNRKAQAALASAEVGTSEYQARLGDVRKAREAQEALSDSYTRLSWLADATRQAETENPGIVERGRTALTEKEGRVEARRVEKRQRESDQVARLAEARAAKKAAAAAQAATPTPAPAATSPLGPMRTRTGTGRRSQLLRRL